jgi:hypothetical protein
VKFQGRISDRSRPTAPTARRPARTPPNLGTGDSLPPAMKEVLLVREAHDGQGMSTPHRHTRWPTVKTIVDTPLRRALAHIHRHSSAQRIHASQAIQERKTRRSTAVDGVSDHLPHRHTAVPAPHTSPGHDDESRGPWEVSHGPRGVLRRWWLPIDVVTGGSRRLVWCRDRVGRGQRPAGIGTRGSTGGSCCGLSGQAPATRDAGGRNGWSLPTHRAPSAGRVPATR